MMAIFYLLLIAVGVWMLAGSYKEFKKEFNVQDERRLISSLAWMGAWLALIVVLTINMFSNE